MKATVVALELRVVSGPDEGRSFRYARVASFEVRARSDPDDEGLALRTAAAAAVVVRFARIGRRWRVERVAGPLLTIDGLPSDVGLLNGGSTLQIGDTCLTVALSRVAAPAPPTPDPTARPAVVGFELSDPIAFGAAAQTWQARRLTDGLLVALKVGRADASEAIRRDFRREAEIAAALAGVPHTAELLASGLAGSRPWLALRWIDGETIEERVAREGGLPLALACRIAREVLGVLEAVHARGFVHRDVNPSNVMIGSLDGGALPSAFLIDFGLGKALRVEPSDATVHPTRTGESMGRPRFMAPEQAADGKRAGPAADLYGLAATLYWTLTRASHIREDPDESPLASLAKGYLVPIRRRRRDVPESLAVALDQALSNDPNRRWAALETLRTALGLVGAGPHAPGTA